MNTVEFRSKVLEALHEQANSHDTINAQLQDIRDTGHRHEQLCDERWDQLLKKDLAEAEASTVTWREWVKGFLMVLVGAVIALVIRR